MKKRLKIFWAPRPDRDQSKGVDGKYIVAETAARAADLWVEHILSEGWATEYTHAAHLHTALAPVNAMKPWEEGIFDESRFESGVTVETYTMNFEGVYLDALNERRGMSI